MFHSVQTRCIVKGEAQKSPLIWRFSGGFWFSQKPPLSRNSTRKPLNWIKSPIFTNTPCKSTCWRKLKRAKCQLHNPQLQENRSEHLHLNSVWNIVEKGHLNFNLKRPRGSCNNTLLRRGLRREARDCFWEGFLEGVLQYGFRGSQGSGFGFLRRGFREGT